MKVVAISTESKQSTYYCLDCKKEFSTRDEKIAQRFLKIHIEKTHGITNSKQREPNLSLFEKDRECAQKSGLKPSNVKIIRH
jgi:hypothetical protein